MNIAEVEKLTGITKQNIRFYEKEGLIEPRRNETNGYREYGSEEINRLKMIRLLRKTGMSLEEIGKVFLGEISFSEAISLQRQRLEQEKNDLLNVMKLCDELKSQNPDYIDVDQYLSRIQKEESEGNMFYQLWEDYRRVAKGEAKKKFSFISDTIINTPQEFTDALLRYAKLQEADITITKEGFYPEFIWNGIEYTAMRVHGRYGATVHCDMIYPEQAEPEGMEDGRRRKLTVLANLMPLFFWEIIIFISTRLMWGESGYPGVFLTMVIFAVAYLATHYPRWKYKFRKLK